MNTPEIGIVIPVLNEVDNLPRLARDIRRLSVPHRVVVVDGGSSDDTSGVAGRLGWEVIGSRRGRGAQMNAGARRMTTPWYLFVHADILIPEPAILELERVLERGNVTAAAWRLGIDSPGRWFRVIEWGAFLRNLLLGLPYGDQGLLVRREAFELAGGFPEIPVMEDVALVRALGRRGGVWRMRSKVFVSPRRWYREGPYRTWLRNVLLITLYLAGVSPNKLAHWYRPEPG